MRSIESAHAEFQADVTYLNTASLGLPPRRSMDALQAALHQWQTGRASPPDYDAPLNASRRSYASLVGVSPTQVAVGSQASVFAGLIAAALPDGAEVLCASGEFTSIVFPFLVQARRGVTVREVPLEDLAREVRASTTLVSVAAVQSADGRLCDLDALTSACAHHSAKILLDTTQAVGWLPIDASRFDYTVCGGYKWLLAPRGTCFFTVRPELMHGLTPLFAAWYAGAEPWSSIYGGPLRLAPDARRFDVSPAWLSWVGQAPSLDLLSDVGPAALHAHALGLANHFRHALDLPDGDSAIVSLATGPGAGPAMEGAGMVGAMRAGRLRLSFHINNSEDDVNHAVEVLDGHVLR